MNSDPHKTPREQLEARITALLLGELSPEEAEQVREAIANDAELTRLHDQLKQTISLVREAETTFAEESSTTAEPVRLSDERREKLLAQFKTVSPVEFQESRRRSLFAPLLRIAAVLAILAVLVALLMPNFTRSRTTAASNAIMNNLRQIDGAKQQWALENNMPADAIPTADDLALYFGRGGGGQLPRPVMGEKYVLGKVSEPVGFVVDGNVARDKFRNYQTEQVTIDGRELTRVNLGEDRRQVAGQFIEPTDLESEEATSLSFGVSPLPARRGLVTESEPASGPARGERASIALPPAEEPTTETNLALNEGSTMNWDFTPGQSSGTPESSTPERFGGFTSGSGYVGGGAGGGGFGGGIDSGIRDRTRQLAENNQSAQAQEQFSRELFAGVTIDPETRRMVAVSDESAVSTSGGRGVGGGGPSERLQRRVPQFAANDQPATAEDSFASAPTDGRLGILPTQSRSSGVEALYDYDVDNRTLNGSLTQSEDQIARIDPATGLPVGTAINPFTGLPTASATPEPRGVARYAPSGERYGAGGQIDTTTGLPAPANERLITRSLDADPNAMWGDATRAGSPSFGVSKTDDEPAPAAGGVYSAEVVGYVNVAPELGENFQLIAEPSATKESENGLPAEVNLELTGITRELGQRRMLAQVDEKLSETKEDKLALATEPGLRRGRTVMPGSELQPLDRLTSRASAVRESVALPQPGDNSQPAAVSSGRTKEVATLVREGIDLYERGQLTDAKVKFEQAQETDPQNRAAGHYLELVEEVQSSDLTGNPERSMGERMLVGYSLPEAQSSTARPEAELELATAVRELEREKRIQEMLSIRTSTESIDKNLPRTSIIDISSTATPEEAGKPTLRERFGRAITGNVERSARIRLEKDVTDVNPVTGERLTSTYDPYFVQAEVEVIKSEEILKEAVEQLGLEGTWARKEGVTSTDGAVSLLKKRLNVELVPNTGVIDIKVKDEEPEEAARLANAVALAYKNHRASERAELYASGIEALRDELAEQDQRVAQAQAKVDALRTELERPQVVEDLPVRRPAPDAPIPQPEVLTRENAFSTFSLNVSDVSFKLAAASLEKGQMPEQATVRSEEFINAFDYRDPQPAPGAPLAFAWERARYPFAHNRDLLRFSVQTAARGREAGCPLNIVLLLDNSGSMERADRVRILAECLRVLAGQLTPQDKLSVVAFSRTARLWVDGVSGDQAGSVAEQMSQLAPQGGTNLEEAMNLAYATALRHYLVNGVNRVVLLTDGAANLGNVDPDALKQVVESHRKQGVALDCFGIGWEGYNDDLLEILSRNGDGRYGFVNSPAEAASGFAHQLAGALQVAASDVKVQVEFNPGRVISYRQVGYAKHQLKQEDFRNNAIDAAEIAAAESGNALYTVELNPRGEGPIGIVRVRYKVPSTGQYHEHAWTVPFNGSADPLDQASPAMRLAATASAFSEWLVASPYAAEVTPDALLGYLRGVPEVYGAYDRPEQLEWMIRQAKSVVGQ